jgi:hypothetical protein
VCVIIIIVVGLEIAVLVVVLLTEFYSTRTSADILELVLLLFQ